MRKICIFLFALHFFSCATFSGNSIRYISAKTSAKSIVQDDIFVLIKKYTEEESDFYLDSDFHVADFSPLYVSIFNNSEDTLLIDPSLFTGYVDINRVNSEMSYEPFAYFFLWSIPWVINLASSLPIYYGIGFPVIGIIAMINTSGGNIERREFYKSNSLKKEILTKGQETSGLVFIKKNQTIEVKINDLIFDLKD